MFASFNISFFAMLVGFSLVISIISQMNLTRMMVAAFRHPYVSIAISVTVSMVIAGLWIWAYTIESTETMTAFMVVGIVEFFVNIARRGAIADAMQVAFHSV